MAESLDVHLALTTCGTLQEIAVFLLDCKPPCPELPELPELSEFFSTLGSSCEVIEFHIKTRSLSNELIVRILDLFESLINSSATTAQTCPRDKHSHQNDLNRGWSDLWGKAEADRVKFAGQSLNIAQLTQNSFRLQFYGHYRSWRKDVTSNDAIGTRYAAVAPTPTKPEVPLFASSMVRSVFKALSGCNTCGCHDAQELDAQLRLDTYRQLGFDDTNDFEVFLSLRQALQETSVKTVKHTKVGFNIDDETRSAPEKPAQNSKRIKDLCSEIKQMQNKLWQRLELKVEEDQLFKLQSKNSCSHVHREKQPITLHQILDGEFQPPLEPKQKSFLAVLLSYAVAHLHDTPWLPPRWDSSKILFFWTSPSEMSLKPCIRAQLVPQGTNTDGLEGSDKEDDCEELDPDARHPFSTLVDLAIILMELYFATTFDVLVRTCAQKVRLPQLGASVRDMSSAQLVFQNKSHEFELTSRFPNIIQTCLNVDTWCDVSKTPLDDASFRDKVYLEIVHPLEEYASAEFQYTTTDWLDNLTKHVRSDSVTQNIPTKVLALAYEGTRSHHETPSVAPPLQKDTPYKLWMKRYKDVYTHFINNPLKRKGPPPVKTAVLDSGMDDSLKSEGPPPVKIAVLDSGIDDSKSWMQSVQISRKYNWITKSEAEVDDDDGHGTFVTSLIVDYARHTDLYIAKVKNKDPVPESVAQAIMSAVEWGADIICMAFGFPTNQVAGYQMVEEAIKQAQHENVLMFAAASNDGGNLGRAYPARDSRVICVHATDALGNRYEASPYAEDDVCNLATVGKNVESSFPFYGDTQTRGINKLAGRRSGTSYATAILTGIAAFLLIYTKQNLSDLAHRLKEKSTMENVLKRIAQKAQPSTNRDGYHYIALSRYDSTLFGKTEAEVRDIISGILKA